MVDLLKNFTKGSIMLALVFLGMTILSFILFWAGMAAYVVFIALVW